VPRAGRDEDCLALHQRYGLSRHLQHAAAIENVVQLVVRVRLLAVGFWRDESIDADLQPWRGVEDLVPAVAGSQALLDGSDVDRQARWNVRVCPGSV